MKLSQILKVNLSGMDEKFLENKSNDNMNYILNNIIDINGSIDDRDTIQIFIRSKLLYEFTVYDLDSEHDINYFLSKTETA